MPEIENARSSEHAEIVVFASGKVMARPHQHASFVLRALDPSGALRLDVDSHVAVRAVGFEPCGDRDINEIVLRLPEGGAERFRHADYLIWLAVHADLMTDGIH